MPGPTVIKLRAIAGAEVDAWTNSDQFASYWRAEVGARTNSDANCELLRALRAMRGPTVIKWRAIRGAEVDARTNSDQIASYCGRGGRCVDQQ